MRGEGGDPFARRLSDKAASLSPTALRVARFIGDNRTLVLAGSASRLAQRLDTSDATIIRSVQALGYKGLPDLKLELAAILDAGPTPADNMRRTLSDTGASVDRAINEVMSVHGEVASQLRTKEARASIAAAVSTLDQAGRIVVFGIGPSSHLASYMALQLSRVGRHATTLDATGRNLADQLLDLRAHDAVCMLAYGRPYVEARAVITEGRRLQLPVVLLTDNATSVLARQADVVILARRGRASRVALHAATVIVLEAIVLGLAAKDRPGALAALDRLNALRDLAAPRPDTGR